MSLFFHYAIRLLAFALFVLSCVEAAKLLLPRALPKPPFLARIGPEPSAKFISDSTWAVLCPLMALAVIWLVLTKADDSGLGATAMLLVTALLAWIVWKNWKIRG